MARSKRKDRDKTNMTTQKRKTFNINQCLIKSQELKKKKFSGKLLTWYQRNKAKHPWRQYWEKYKSPYHIWVSEIMLQQTLIAVVSPIYIKFIKKFPSIALLAKATEEDLRQAVRGLGYYNRFDRLHRAAKLLHEANSPNFWPQDYLAWKKLPGIGEYTASAICSIAFNQKKAVVDGNVERVLSRIFSIHEPINTSKMKRSLQQINQELISHKFPGDYNQAIMELGQTLCNKTKPLCTRCPVKASCKSFSDKTQEQLPTILKKEQKEEIEIYALMIKHQNKIFLSKRENNSIFLKKRIGFPLRKKTPKNSFQFDSLGSYRHNITKYKINIHVVMTDKKNLREEDVGLWVDQKKLKEKLVTSLDLKALKYLD